MKKSKAKQKKWGSDKLAVACWHRGDHDRRDGLPSRPPKNKVYKTAYLNGYYQR